MKDTISKISNMIFQLFLNRVFKSLINWFISVILMVKLNYRLQSIISEKGFLEVNKDVVLPEASTLWQMSGLLLFVLSVSYTLIDNIITSNHLQLFFGFFIAIIMTVVVTVIIEIRSRKLKS